MQTRSGRHSEELSSYCSSEGHALKYKRRKHNCNGLNSPSKKCKLQFSSSSMSSLANKYLIVKLTDMLKDENLCSKYALHQKLKSSSNKSKDIENNCCNTVETQNVTEHRKIELKNNLITITKKVVKQNVEEETEKVFNCSSKQYDCSASISSNTTDWDALLNDNFKNYPKTWQKNYDFIENEVYRISSHDIIFEAAQFYEEIDNQFKNGVPNIKVQFPNNFTDELRAFNQNSTKSYSSASSTSSFDSSFGTQLFKMPLPPAKRPPSRPKKMCSSNSSSSCSTTTELTVSTKQGKDMKNGPEDEDALSISASTFVDEPVLQVPEMNTINNYQRLQFSPSESEIAAIKNDDIQRWLENSNAPCNDNTEPLLLDFETKQLINNDSTTASVPDTSCCKTKTKTLTPSIYKNICVFYFLDNKKCTHRNCKFNHNLDSSKVKTIQKMELQELKETYKWTLQSKLLFTQTFIEFVERFSRLKEVTELISMVNDILNMELFDRTPYIEKVIFALQKTGLTFKSAVETLIEQRDSTNVTLLDILLNIIIDTDQDLADNWCLIKEILKYRSENVDFGVLNDIIKKTLKSGNKDLCRDVCDIFSQLQDFSNLDTDLLKEFLNLLYSHKLILRYNVLKNKTKIDHTIKEVSSQFTLQDKYELPDDSTTASFTFLSNEMLQNYRNEVSTFTDSDGSSTSACLRINTTETGVQTDSPQSGLNSNCCSLELDDNEICELVQSLRSENINAFLALLNKYKFTDKADSFALNTVVYINSHQVDRQYFSLLKSFELVCPDFMEDPPTKAIIELISYNVLDFLTRQNMWNVAYRILEKFESSLDTFIKSREFKKNHLIKDRNLAERYLYMCKIYIKNNKYEKALDIFKREDWNLLKPSSKWSLEYGNETELYRNKIIIVFLQGALTEQSNYILAFDFIHHVVKFIENDKFIKEVWHFYNNLIVLMLNIKEIYTNRKDGMYTNYIIQEFKKKIFPSWFKNLKKNVLRALGVVILRLKCVGEKDSIEFYNKCCMQGVYPICDGTESEITVTTDLINEEIYLTLLTFFYKIAEKRHKPTSLKINIKCPDKVYYEPKVLYNSDVGFTEMKKRITNVLIKAFFVSIEESEISSVNRFVVIKENYIVDCVKRLQRQYGVV